MDEPVAMQQVPFEVWLEIGRTCWWLRGSTRPPFDNGAPERSAFSPIGKHLRPITDPTSFCGGKRIDGKPSCARMRTRL